MATLSFCSLPTNLDWSQAKLLHQWWHAYIFLSSDYIVFKSLPDTILLTLVPIIFFCNRILYIEILKFLIEIRYLLLILNMEKNHLYPRRTQLWIHNICYSILDEFWRKTKVEESKKDRGQQRKSWTLWCPYNAYRK